jgi:hypothetical protein
MSDLQSDIDILRTLIRRFKGCLQHNGTDKEFATAAVVPEEAALDRIAAALAMRNSIDHYLPLEAPAPGWQPIESIPSAAELLWMCPSCGARNYRDGSPACWKCKTISPPPGAPS